MTHTTSDAYLFTSEQRHYDEMRCASDALLIALQREHPAIVRHLQDLAIVGRMKATQS